MKVEILGVLVLSLLLLTPVGAEPTKVQPPVQVLASPQPQLFGFLATQGMKLVELRVVAIPAAPVTLKVEDFEGKVLFNGPPRVKQKLPVSPAGVRVWATGKGGSVNLQPRFQ